ncbi:MAG: alpha/beta fold hydrolase [Ardenticatenaceae bacterium]
MDGHVVLRRYAPAVALMGGAVSLLQAVMPKHEPAALADAEKRLLGHVKTPLSTLFVQAGAYRIRTIIGGDGPPLVMLHGHGGGVGSWFPNYDALAEHFRIYAIDWLGWGRSDRPYFDGKSTESALDWWLESLEAWRKKMGLTNFFLLGHSLGGWMATEYALAYGQHVRQLIIENPAGIVDHLTLRKTLLYYISPQRLVQALGPFGSQLVEHSYREQMADHTAGNALINYYYHLSLAPLSGQMAFQRVLNLNPLQWNSPLEPRAEQLNTPTTIIWGVNDHLFPMDLGQLLHARLPLGHFMPIANARHTPHLEDPEGFAEAVIRTKYEGLHTSQAYDPFSVAMT